MLYINDLVRKYKSGSIIMIKQLILVLVFLLSNLTSAQDWKNILCVTI